MFRVADNNNNGTALRDPHNRVQGRLDQLNSVKRKEWRVVSGQWRVLERSRKLWASIRDSSAWFVL
jgi:hypothetical protein